MLLHLRADHSVQKEAVAAPKHLEILGDRRWWKLFEALVEHASLDSLVLRLAFVWVLNQDALKELLLLLVVRDVLNVREHILHDSRLSILARVLGMSLCCTAHPKAGGGVLVLGKRRCLSLLEVMGVGDSL